MIPSGFIQELLARIDIVEIVGRHVELKKAGINYKGLCPFHGEKSPSFIVSPSRQTYHCFGCGVHGNAIRFLTEHHAMNFVEAVRDLAQSAGLVVPEEETSPLERAEAARQREQQATLTEVLTKAGDHYRRQLKANPRAVAYLKGRGLTGEIALRFGLGYAPEGWRTLASVFARYDDPLLAESGMVIVQGEDAADQKRYDRFRDRIMFPIRNVKGETIAFGGRVLDHGEPKYLNSPETPVFIKGRELYGLYEARTGMRDKGYALVTEGYMDVVALAQLGFPNAVATLGTACTAEHVHKLLRFTDQVVFSFDGDAAGRRAAGRALEAALPQATDVRNFRFLFLPSEHDPDSYIRAFGKDGFEACVRNAVPLSRQLVEQASQDCELNSAEGRAKMLAQARPLWGALPEGTLRIQLLSDLARIGGLPADELANLWQNQSAGRGNFGAAREAHDHDPAHARNDEARHRGRFLRNDRHLEAASRQTRRTAPKRPEDRVVQMLFGQPAWWDRLPAAEHELLHNLPAPHGPAIAWLERELAEYGPRPWAIVREALASDESLPPDSRALADGDADPDASEDDLGSAIGLLVLRAIHRRMEALVPEVSANPQAMQAYRALSKERDALKERQMILSQRSPSE